VPVRLTGLERELAGASRDSLAERVTAAHVASALAPIDDVRASARYRVDAATVLVRRALVQCAAAGLEAAA
jgi:CO/xanthine dehydrogenase FAD-binding subunit